MRYSIDTSAILDAWRRSYPPDTFPIIWQKLDSLIENGELVATEEVLIELEKKDDEVHKWAHTHEKMFIPIDDKIQIEVQNILKQHKRLVDSRKNRSGADPFVIALAKVGNCIVITNESPANNISRPKIPDVCAALGIRSINFLQLIKAQGWVFGS